MIGFLQVTAFVATSMDAGGFVKAGMWGAHPYFLDRWGAKNTARILYEGEWWRLLTPLFLHSGLGHLFANLLVQVRLGVSLELLWGRWKWLPIYVLSGIYAALASCVCLPDTLSVGCSGAICGLLGAEIVYIMVNWRQTEQKDILERNIQICTFLIAVAVTAGISFLPMVDFAAHAGGFSTGVLMACILFADCLEAPAAKERLRAGACSLLVIMFTITIFFLVWRVAPDKQLLNICRPEEC